VGSCAGVRGRNTGHAASGLDPVKLAAFRADPIRHRRSRFAQTRKFRRVFWQPSRGRRAGAERITMHGTIACEPVPRISARCVAFAETKTRGGVLELWCAGMMLRGRDRWRKSYATISRYNRNARDPGMRSGLDRVPTPLDRLPPSNSGRGNLSAFFPEGSQLCCARDTTPFSQNLYLKRCQDPDRAIVLVSSLCICSCRTISRHASYDVAVAGSCCWGAFGGAGGLWVFDS